MSPRGGDGGRRQLQVTLGVLAGIPFASGLTGMLAGPAAAPGGTSRVTASLDSEYRFTNAFWFATAPLVWSALPRVERETALLRTTLGVIFVGGFARLVSWRATGRPHPVFIAALGLELFGVPGLLLWQRAVSRRAGTGG